jgi:hypothetical protein
VAHARKSSFSEGRDQEDQLKPAGQIVLEILSQKYPSQKKGWWSGSRCRPALQKKKKSSQRILKKNVRKYS